MISKINSRIIISCKQGELIINITRLNAAIKIRVQFPGSATFTPGLPHKNLSSSLKRVSLMLKSGLETKKAQDAL